MSASDDLIDAVRAGCTGDPAALRSLVLATQEMAYAVGWRIVGNEADARDVVQESYLTAFRRLNELAEPRAFAGWLRRIVVAASLNHRRRSRTVWVPLDALVPPPVFDAEEHRWTDEQQRLMARAILTLSREERHLAERFYHGGMTADRLAQEAGVEPAVMRKRLQRTRDKLRKEVEMDEKSALRGTEIPKNLPDSITELLARPRLVDLPENPVGLTLAALLGAFGDFSSIDVPEEIDLDEAQRRLGGDAVYIDRTKLQRVAGERVLRYDLSLPLLMGVRWAGTALRLSAAGKAYRREQESATHLEAFHQLEVFTMDRRESIDTWAFAGRVFDSVERALPRSEIRVTPTEYPMCARAWSLDVRHDGDWREILAWGEYAEWVIRALGGEPGETAAIGAGFGLERIAALRFGIDDIRKMGAARVTAVSTPLRSDARDSPHG